MKTISEILMDFPQELYAKAADEKQTKREDLTPEQISAIDNLMADLQELHNRLSESFQLSSEVTSDDSLHVMSELISSDDFTQYYQKIDNLLKTDWFRSPRHEFLIMSLRTALEYKKYILDGEAESLETEIINLRNQINSPSEKKSEEADLKAVKKKLANREACMNSVNKLKNMTNAARINRYNIEVDQFRTLTTDLPAYLLHYPVIATKKGTLADLYYELKLKLDGINSLAQAQDETSHYQTLLDLFRKYEETRDQFVISLSMALNAHLTELRESKLTHETYEKLSIDYEKLILFSTSLLQTTDDLETYRHILEKFSQSILDFASRVDTQSESKEEMTNKELEKFIKTEADSQFPNQDFKYQFSGLDLVHDGNDFIKLQFNFNPNLPILAGSEDNVLQVGKDVGRNLRLQSKLREQYRQYTVSMGDDLKKTLIELFGITNTNRIIRHYDQGINFLVGAAPTVGTTSTDTTKDQKYTLDVGLITFTQDIYTRQDVAFRDTERDHYLIKLNEAELTRTLIRLEDSPDDKLVPNDYKIVRTKDNTWKLFYISSRGVPRDLTPFMQDYRLIGLKKILGTIPQDAKESGLQDDKELFKDIENTLDVYHKTWLFKAKCKVLSRATDNGFAVERMGTDSALIANALMRHNSYENLKSIIETVMKAQDDLEVVFVKENKDKKPDTQRDIIITTALKEIENFKNGKLNFDYLVGLFQQLSNASRIIHRKGFAGKFQAGKDKDLITLLQSIHNSFKTIKSEMDEKAKLYLVSPSSPPAAELGISPISSRRPERSLSFLNNSKVQKTKENSDNESKSQDDLEPPSPSSLSMKKS